MKVKTQKAARKLVSAINAEKRSVTKPYDTQGTVQRVEGSTAYVKFAGGKRETPVRKTISCRPGDIVQIRVADKSAWITGNLSAPPTDDRQATDAKKKADAAQEFAEGVKTVADEAQKIAGDSAQHFWHTETGTDTGVHITEVTRDEFLDDPSNAGYNLLARSNGVAVRDGLTELAVFGAGYEMIGPATGHNLLIDSSQLVFENGSKPLVIMTDTGKIMLYKEVSGNSVFYGEMGIEGPTSKKTLYIASDHIRLVSTDVDIERFTKDSDGFSNLFHLETVSLFPSTSISAGSVESGSVSVTVDSGLEVLGIVGHNVTDTGDVNVYRLYISGQTKGNKVTVSYAAKNVGSTARTTALEATLLCVKVGG